MDNQCHYCGWHQNGHDKGCPEVVKTKLALKEWEAGYTSGTTGEQLSDDATQAFRLGWLRGNVALEERMNT